MTQATLIREFVPGTTGWTVRDLSDPETQLHWSRGRYEIVEGVLTTMPPQGFQGISPLSRLRRLLERHLDQTGQSGEFHNETDLLLRRGRVARPDMIFLTPAQQARQSEMEAKRKLLDTDYRPVFVMPLLVVESVSPGHEDHDRLTKRDWYAQAEIPNYWLLSAHEKSLECLKLQGKDYVVESSAQGTGILRAGLFGGVTIAMEELWKSHA